MVFCGNIVGNYRLSRAQIRPLPQGLNLRQGNQFLHYDFSAPILHESPKQEALHDTIGKIDRAWAIEDDILYKTQIVREKWPLEAVQCNRFETNFFEGARSEGILRVRETIDYTWLPAEPVLELNKENMLPKAIELAYH